MRALLVCLLSPALAFAGMSVAPWTPPNISSGEFESHPAFDPLTGDLYFVRSAADFTGWRMMHARCGQQGWEPAAPAAFAGDGVEADPWFTHDGRALYFISTRSTDGVHKPDLDLWRVSRDESLSWAIPQRLPAPLNSGGREWFPREAVDGWLYFGSDREGGFGKTDIWRARETAPGQWLVENAGAAINAGTHDFEAEMSPDGKRLIIMTDVGLFESRHTRKGWSARERLPAEINANGSEVGALFSPSGRSLLFARDTPAPKSGEFFIWHLQPELWPPACGPAR